MSEIGMSARYQAAMVFSASLMVMASAEVYSQDINAYCEAEWGTNYRMQKYCRDKENAALTQLGRIKIPGEILRDCEQKWNYPSMLLYCVEQQMEAKAFLDGSSTDSDRPDKKPKTEEKCQCPKGRPLDAPLNRVVSAYVGHAEFLDTNVVAIEGKPLQLYGVTPNGSDKRSVTRAMNDKIRGRQVSCEIRDRNIYGDPMVVCLVGKFDLNSWMVFEGFVDAGTITVPE